MSRGVPHNHHGAGSEHLGGGGEHLGQPSDGTLPPWVVAVQSFKELHELPFSSS